MSDEEEEEEEAAIWAHTTNFGGTQMTINLRNFFTDQRFYRDNPDVALKEAMAYADKVEVVMSLIERGVDVNATDDDGTGALIMNVYNGRIPVIQCLIEQGVNVNVVSLYGMTAMDASDDTEYNKEETVKMLNDAGALRVSNICAECGMTTNSCSPPDERMQTLKMKRCSRCKTVYYCSLACQKVHWRSKHREYCSKISNWNA